MRKRRSDIGNLRREQIVEAAVAIIAEQGIQNLSLSEIEQRAGMSRGQLTYYFPAKEDILLAVFDRFLALMCQRQAGPEGEAPRPEFPSGSLGLLRFVLEVVLQEPEAHPEFHSLQYTFLAQLAHREDFRRRLDTLYEAWRDHMARALEADLAGNGAPPRASPRALATFIQAVLHGLVLQKAVNPKTFDRDEMRNLCLDVLGSYLKLGPAARGRKGAAPAANNKKQPRGSRTTPRRPRRTVGLR